MNRLRGVAPPVQPFPDLAGIEADEPADLDVGDAFLGDEPADVEVAGAEMCGEVVDVGSWGRVSVVAMGDLLVLGDCVCNRYWLPCRAWFMDEYGRS